MRYDKSFEKYYKDHVVNMSFDIMSKNSKNGKIYFLHSKQKTSTNLLFLHFYI